MPASSPSRRRSTPTAPPMRSFSFQVQDNGGTAEWRRRSRPDAEHADRQRHRGQRRAERGGAAAMCTRPFPENTSTAARIKVADIAITDVDGGTNNLSLSGADASLFQTHRPDAVAEGRRPARLRDQPAPQRHRQRQRPDGRRPGRRVRQALAIAVTDIAETITGTPRADRLVGTNNGETINGLAGNDTIFGNGGNDRIIGGLGADRMTGGPGNDVFVFNSIGDSAPGQSGYVNSGTFSCAVRTWPPRRHHRLHARPGQDRPVGDRRQQPGRRQPGLHLARPGPFHDHHPGELIYRLYNFSRHRQRQDHHLWRRQRRRPRRLPDRADGAEGAGGERFCLVSNSESGTAPPGHTQVPCLPVPYSLLPTRYFQFSTAAAHRSSGARQPSLSAMMPPTMRIAAAIRQRVTDSPSASDRDRHGEQDRRLAQRRHRGDRRPGHRPHGDPVGTRREQAGDQPGPPFRQHRGDDRPAAQNSIRRHRRDRVGKEQPCRVARRRLPPPARRPRRSACSRRRTAR